MRSGPRRAIREAERQAALFDIAREVLIHSRQSRYESPPLRRGDDVLRINGWRPCTVRLRRRQGAARYGGGAAGPFPQEPGRTVCRPRASDALCRRSRGYAAAGGA
jgi:hypothetical protein